MYRLRYTSKGMLTALSLAIIIAFVLSLIPNSKIINLYQDFPVFSPREQIELNNENIVDFISPLSNKMQIKKVKWEHNILSVDFYVNDDSNIDTSGIYEEFYNITKKSFVESTNIKEVLLRVFIDDMNKVFVAVSAQKKDIVDNPKMELESSMVYKDFLEKYFGLNYGNLLK